MLTVKNGHDTVILSLSLSQKAKDQLKRKEKFEYQYKSFDCLNIVKQFVEEDLLILFLLELLINSVVGKNVI